MNFTNEDLTYMVSHGIINEDDVRNQIKEMKNKEILKQHNQRVWQAKDGRWKTYLPDSTKPKNRRLIAKSTEKDINAAIINYYKEVIEKPTKYTFKDLYLEWLKRHSVTASKGTIERIEVDFNRFYKTADFINSDITTLQAYDLKHWLEKQIANHALTKTSYNNIKTIIINTLTHAHESKKLDYNLWEQIKVNTKKVKKTSKSKSETQVFNRKERQLLMDQAMRDYNNNPDYVVPLMILLCDQLGLRNGELCALKPEDIVDGKFIWIQRQEIKYHNEDGNLVREIVDDTKSDDGNRKLTLSEKAKEILSYLPKDQEYLFELNNRRVTCSKTDAYIRRLCKKVNIPVRSMHKIRKTYISTLFSVGLHPEKIREISGHKDMQTLYKSYCFCIDNETEILEKINKAS